MFYSPAFLNRPAEVTVTAWSYQSLGESLVAVQATSPTSQNYIAANVVIYIPFWVPTPATAMKMVMPTGSAAAGNVDLGIYGTDGTLLVSTGTTALTVVTNTQEFNITDTTLTRGLYYMAIVSDTSGVTQKVIASLPAAGILQSFGLLEQASVTLPLATNASPATFAKYTRAFIPMFGVQFYRTAGPV